MPFLIDFGRQKGAQREPFWEPKRSQKRSQNDVQIEARKSSVLESFLEGLRGEKTVFRIRLSIIFKNPAFWFQHHFLTNFWLNLGCFLVSKVVQKRHHFSHRFFDRFWSQKGRPRGLQTAPKSTQFSCHRRPESHLWSQMASGWLPDGPALVRDGLRRRFGIDFWSIWDRFLVDFGLIFRLVFSILFEVELLSRLLSYLLDLFVTCFSACFPVCFPSCVFYHIFFSLLFFLRSSL